MSPDPRKPSHIQNLKILLLLFRNFLVVGTLVEEDASGANSRMSLFFCFSFSCNTLVPNSGMCLTVDVEVTDAARESILWFASVRGRLMSCVDKRRARFGLAGVVLSFERSIHRSVPAARFASRRRRLDGRVSLSSKSVGRNAVGALWKSTMAGAGRRSVADRDRMFP